MALGGLGALAGLSGLTEGYLSADAALQQRQLRQLQMQNYLREQQAMGNAQRALAAYRAPSQSAVPGVPQMGGPDQVLSPQPSAMPLPQVPPATSQMSAPLGTIAKYESGGRNVPNYRFDEGHTASGPWQITDSTWNRYATGLGAPKLSYPQSPMDRPVPEQAKVADAIYKKEGDAPWTNYNPQLAHALHSDIQQKGQVFQRLGAPQPVIQDATQTAQTVASSMPPEMWGAAQLSDLARQVEAANPDADPAVNFMTVVQLQKLLAPQEKMQFQAILAQNRQLFMAEMQNMRQQFLAQQGQANRDVKIEIAGANAAVRESEGAANRDAAADRQRIGIAAVDARQGLKGGAIVDKETPDSWEGMPDKPPPNSGIPQAIWAAALTYAQTGKMPAIGFSSGPRTQILAAQPAAQKALGIKPSEAATEQAEYHGLQAGENTLGRRLANLTTSISEAEKAAPAVIQTSKGVPRTEFTSINEFTNWLNSRTGDPNIVRFRGALNTFLNIYAKGINPTGQMTDQQQRHAYETLSAAMSQGQIEAGIDQLTKELGYAKEGLSTATGELKGMFQPPGLKHGSEKIIEKGGKRWRVIGGDPNDPEVEEVK